jgi:hypothetical protein
VSSSLCLSSVEKVFFDTEYPISVIIFIGQSLFTRDSIAMIQKLEKTASEIFGNFIERPLNQEYLNLEFSPSSLPLKLRWRNNGLSADFLADYLSTYFPGDEDEPIALQKNFEIKFAVSYIANELLENAMKYCDKTTQHPITMSLQFNWEEIRVLIKNSVGISEAKNFKSFINELLSSHPYDFYMRQLEKNAENNNDGSYGLGFLTIINDYNVKIGWKFEPVEQEPSLLIVSSMVQLQI